MSKNLIWLKRDLRAFDQPLLRDFKKDPQNSELIYLRFLEQNQEASDAQIQFQEACLANVSAELAASVSKFDVSEATFESDFEKILRGKKTERLLTSSEFSAHECERNLQVSKLCAKMGIEFVELNTFSLFPETDLDTLPLIFTDYRKKAELQPVEFADLDSMARVPEKSPALSRLRHFVFETKRILTYKETRDGMLDPDDSSHFSPYLAQGAISVKRIWYEIERFERMFESNESTYWLKFELLWREFFLWNAKKYQRRLFNVDGIRQKSLSFSHDEALVNAWKMGKTPNRFINANLNELRLTGWMSNRGRQNVASYFIHDLGLNWTLGARWFQSQLIDYEPCANWGNWAYLAGVGNDPRPFRKFNVEWQQQKHDPDGSYTNRWSPI